MLVLQKVAKITKMPLFSKTDLALFAALV